MTQEVAQSAPTETSAPVAAETPAVAPVVEAPKEDPDIAARFAALTRKERAIVERERHLKQLQSDPSFKEYQTYAELRKDPRRNAAKLVESLGVPIQDFYQDLTDLVLNNNKPSVELELKALKDELTRKEREQLEKSQKADLDRQDQALNDYKFSVAETVDKNGDEFELMKLHGSSAVDLALEVAQQFYEQNEGLPLQQRILDHKKACQAVEKWLEDESRKLLTTKKLGVKSETPPETPVEAAKSTAPTVTKLVQNPQKTLTNSNSAAPVTSTVPSQNHLMDPEKRRQWTAQKLKAAWEAKGKV